MRVISQNGMIDIPYEVTAFHANGTFIRINMVGDTGKGTVIAEYKTTNKVQKAMKMLRNAYAGMPVVFENVDVTDDVVDVFKRTKMNGIVAITDDKKSKIEYVNNVVFQFPKDEEVEV